MHRYLAALFQHVKIAWLATEYHISHRNPEFSIPLVLNPHFKILMYFLAVFLWLESMLSSVTSYLVTTTTHALTKNQTSFVISYTGISFHPCRSNIQLHARLISTLTWILQVSILQGIKSMQWLHWVCYKEYWTKSLSNHNHKTLWKHCCRLHINSGKSDD